MAYKGLTVESGELSGFSSDFHSSVEEDLDENPPSLHSATHSIQSTNPDPSKSLMVIGSSTDHHGQPLIPGARIRPSAGQPLLLPSSQPDHLRLRDGTNVPGSNRNQVHAECTEEGEYSLSVNETTPLLIGQQEPALTALKLKIRCNPCSCVCAIFAVIVFVLSVVGCAVIAGGLQLLCPDYTHHVDLYSNVTALLNTTLDNYCHTSLQAQEVKATQDDSTEQELELYALSCGKIQTFQERVEVDRYDYENLTGALPFFDNALFTVYSNVSVNVSVSTYSGQSSTIYVCLFNQKKYYEKFKSEWRDSMQYAVSCQHKTISSAQTQVLSIFTYVFQKSGTYFIGLASESMLARLDVHLYGFKHLYVRNKQDRVNCTLVTFSDPPCQIPLLPDESFPCVLAYVKPPPDLRNGYTGLQLTSKARWTLKRQMSVVVPVLVGLIVSILSVAGFVVCIRKVFCPVR